MDDAHRAGLAAAETAKGGVEVFEGAVIVHEELGVEGGVGCDGGGATDFRPRNGEDSGDRRGGDFDDGEHGGSARRKVGYGAEGGGVETFGDAYGVVDDEEDRGKGCRGEHRLCGEFGHG